VRAIRRRSDCPISSALDIFGDKWSLLVLRDLLFQGKGQFTELLRAEERIASNVLADRLQRLEHSGLVDKVPGPTGRERTTYVPTEKARDLVPTMLELMAWSAAHVPGTTAPPELISAIKNDRAAVFDHVRRAGRL